MLLEREEHRQRRGHAIDCGPLGLVQVEEWECHRPVEGGLVDVQAHAAAADDGRPAAPLAPPQRVPAPVLLEQTPGQGDPFVALALQVHVVDHHTLRAGVSLPRERERHAVEGAVERRGAVGCHCGWFLFVSKQKLLVQVLGFEDPGGSGEDEWV
ncbi:uncharacterized protein BO66DRAFT_55796 [Aspergillus aculeatinus CBS 121060]|uniref:Uncharacterized protein n=1 Tax=Aspergillus aculeatinus CBS 121060 TaxID=1448322 RepID=A0ACD1HCJ1_9EURO|nr:hypothetical protein BO66DRAFT_55796 [Aspergillus aculeatinus CBS 121060]RAH71289.1 hypothetical protein BO66DRAFT_55796 [Aspergillus aculeatinus CBS 121060]